LFTCKVSPKGFRAVFYISSPFPKFSWRNPLFSRGVALDVYVGEFERPPELRLWDDERVVITPHVSAATDVPEHRGVKLFCENLTRCLEGLPLENVIDWERGY
jgi:hypothetical protein